MASNNKEVRGGQQVHRWEDHGVIKLQRVFPAKSVVGIKSCLVAKENFCGGVKDNRLCGERISRLDTAPFLYTFSFTVESQSCLQD